MLSRLVCLLCLILSVSFLHCSASPFLPTAQRARTSCRQFSANPLRQHSQRLIGKSSSLSISRSSTAFIDPTQCLAAIGAFYKNAPLASAFVTCAIKGAAADWVAQSKTQRSYESSTIRFELKRNLAFFLYGGVYQGLGFELLYNVLFPKLFGDSVAKKVGASVFVLTPCVTLPIAYLFKALVFQQSFYDAIQHYKNDVMEKGLLTKYWLMWIPLQTICFAMVPRHFRISFIAAFSFFWMIIFSIISSDS